MHAVIDHTGDDIGIIGVIISRKIMKRNWILFVSMFGANIAVMLSDLRNHVESSTDKILRVKYPDST